MILKKLVDITSPTLIPGASSKQSAQKDKIKQSKGTVHSFICLFLMELFAWGQWKDKFQTSTGGFCGRGAAVIKTRLVGGPGLSPAPSGEQLKVSAFPAKCFSIQVIKRFPWTSLSLPPPRQGQDHRACVCSHPLY